MEPRYLWIFCYDTLRVLCIKLSDEDFELIKKYNTFEEFLCDNGFEFKYNFNLSYYNWILSDNCEAEKIGFKDGYKD